MLLRAAAAPILGLRAGDRSTAAKYSSRVDDRYPRLAGAGLLTSASTSVGHPAGSSHRGGQGFESPQLHPVRGGVDTF